MSPGRQPLHPCTRRRRFLIRRTKGGRKKEREEGREVEDEIDGFVVCNGGREARDWKWLWQ